MTSRALVYRVRVRSRSRSPGSDTFCCDFLSTSPNRIRLSTSPYIFVLARTLFYRAVHFTGNPPAYILFCSFLSTSPTGYSLINIPIHFCINPFTFLSTYILLREIPRSPAAYLMMASCEMMFCQICTFPSL